MYWQDKVDGSIIYRDKERSYGRKGPRGENIQFDKHNTTLQTRHKQH